MHNINTIWYTSIVSKPKISIIIGDKMFINYEMFTDKLNYVDM